MKHFHKILMEFRAGGSLLPLSLPFREAFPHVWKEVGDFGTGILLLWGGQEHPRDGVFHGKGRRREGLLAGNSRGSFPWQALGPGMVLGRCLGKEFWEGTSGRCEVP